MTLMRVVFAGALLLGVGCELQDDRKLGTEEGVARLGIAAPAGDTADEMIPAVAMDTHAMARATAPDGLLGDEAFDDRVLAAGKGKDGGGGGKDKPTCTFCSKRECYSATHVREEDAKARAQAMCEADHDRCRFRGCE